MFNHNLLEDRQINIESWHISSCEGMGKTKMESFYHLCVC